jgi:hypothetical protein
MTTACHISMEVVKRKARGVVLGAAGVYYWCPPLVGALLPLIAIRIGREAECTVSTARWVYCCS